MKLNISSPLGSVNIEFIDGSDESIDGYNIETTSPCHQLLGGFRNREVDPVAVPNSGGPLDSSDALQKQPTERTVAR